MSTEEITTAIMTSIIVKPFCVFLLDATLTMSH
jgi:hypothetical protein